MMLLPKTVKQKRRFNFLLLSLLSMLCGVSILLYSFGQFAVYYYTPTEIYDQSLEQTRSTYRIGGIVVKGSVSAEEDYVRFILSDGAHEIKVRFKGILPSLFREESGAVAEGKFNDSNIFIADSMLAKHDETYRPPDINSH